MVKLESLGVEKFYNLKALICITLAIVTLLIAILSSSWVESKGYHRGLWKICMYQDDVPELGALPYHPPSIVIDNGASEPDSVTGCWTLGNMERIPGWWIVCLTLISCAMIFLIASIMSFTVAMLKSATTTNYRCVNVTMVALILSAISASAGLLIFPLELRKAVLSTLSTARRWEISWSYGLAWSSVIFTLGAILALFLDKRGSAACKDGPASDSIYYYNDKEANSSSSASVSRDNVQV